MVGSISISITTKELSIALVATIRADQQDSRAKRGREGSDGVEFRGKDLEHNQGKGELAQGSAHIGTFKGPLSSANLDQSGRVILASRQGGSQRTRWMSRRHFVPDATVMSTVHLCVDRGRLVTMPL